MIQTKKELAFLAQMHDSVLRGKFRVKCWQLREEKYNLGKAFVHIHNYFAYIELTVHET